MWQWYQWVPVWFSINLIIMITWPLSLTITTLSITSKVILMNWVSTRVLLVILYNERNLTESELHQSIFGNKSANRFSEILSQEFHFNSTIERSMVSTSLYALRWPIILLIFYFLFFIFQTIITPRMIKKSLLHCYVSMYIQYSGTNAFISYAHLYLENIEVSKMRRIAKKLISSIYLLGHTNCPLKSAMSVSQSVSQSACHKSSNTSRHRFS